MHKMGVLYIFQTTSDINMRRDEIKIHNLIQQNPVNVKWEALKYFLCFDANPNVRYHSYDMNWMADCWWNDRGCTYKGVIKIHVHQVDTLIEKLSSGVKTPCPIQITEE